MSKADFLVEIGTEELPPVALKGLADAFHQNLTALVKEANLAFDSSHVYATPRRLAIVLEQLETQQADQTSRRLGPALAAAFDADGKPTKAAEGFARSCGLTVADLDTFDTDKGQRLGLDITVNGLPAATLLPELITKAVQQIPIPKAMRWGSNNESFVRPVKWLVVLHADELIPMTLLGVSSGNESRGHRFMSSGPVTISDASSYVASMEQAKVIACQQSRMAMIKEQVISVAKEHGFVAVVDDSLVEEVSALVEWPVALLGNFEVSFLSVPKEALISTMAKNQKYFHLQDEEGNLVPHFITLANIESPDPAQIIAGNEKVIRPRLADAQFFFEQDSKHPLTHWASKLENIVFQNKLGSVADKCQRIANIATYLAPSLGADKSMVSTAAGVCKADLVTDMVNEFPSLQGIMGKYYARLEGLPEEVCTSLEEIYLPRQASGELPETATGICLSLADRLDSLVGIFGINQVPTGNKDPFALRRAALGIINICIAHKLDLDLEDMIAATMSAFSDFDFSDELSDELLSFFSGRLRALALESGFSAQEFNSVEALKITKPYDFWLRIKAVSEFAKLSEADVLAESNKRVANILDKNTTAETTHDINPSLLVEQPEQELYKAITDARPAVLQATETQHYTEAFQELKNLKQTIDAFFDSVMVMHEDVSTKNNRLALLHDLRQLFLSVADISHLQK